MNSLSVCMIVKNEEESLPRCLKSMAGLWDELIVVDTGSSDKTPAIAADYGARVLHDPWRSDFSYSRNVSLQNATKQWILWLDADDLVPPEAFQKILKIKQEFPLDSAFGFNIQNSTDGVAGQVFQQIRIFPNRSDIRFEFRVHEQVLPSIQRAGLKVLYSDIQILHTGYRPESRKSKQERNLALLEQELKSQKARNPVTLFMMGGALVDLGRAQESVRFYEEAYRIAEEKRIGRHVRDEVPLVLANLGLEWGNTSMLECWIQVARQVAADHIKLHFLEGRLAERQNDPHQARNFFEKVLGAQEKPAFVPIDYRMFKIQACASLGKLYGFVFKDKHRMVEILELAQKLAGERSV